MLNAESASLSDQIISRYSFLWFVHRQLLFPAAVFRSEPTTDPWFQSWKIQFGLWLVGFWSECHPSNVASQWLNSLQISTQQNSSHFNLFNYRFLHKQTAETQTVYHTVHWRDCIQMSVSSSISFWIRIHFQLWFILSVHVRQSPPSQSPNIPRRQDPCHGFGEEKYVPWLWRTWCIM